MTGYHHAMITAPFKLAAIAALTILLAACAPTAPLTMPDREVAPAPEFPPAAVRGQAGRGDRHADAEVQALKAALESPDMGADVTLSLLIDFPLSELMWQLQRHASGSSDTDRAVRPWLRLAVLARQSLLDDDALAAAMRDWAARYPQQAALGPDPTQWVQAWRAVQAPPAGIAVWLPTETGPLGRAGEALREGLMTAWLALPQTQRPRLAFVYTDGDSDEAIGATLQRLAQLDTELMIGPLARTQVEALVKHPITTQRGLVLNEPLSTSPIHRDSARLTRFALLPEDEAMVAADLALAQGYRRALVLAQDSDWGRRLAEAFETAMVAGGGQVLGSGFYASNQVDHSELLEALLGLNQSSARLDALNRLLGETLRSEPQRRSDMDVIFLASRADEARLIRPQLRFFRAEAVPVVATSYSLDGVPDPHRDADLRGLLMPLPAWFQEASPAADLRSQAGFDQPTLSRLFAMGHDSLNLAVWLERMAEDADLELPALIGRLRVSETGRVVRRLDAVELGRGRLQQ